MYLSKYHEYGLRSMIALASRSKPDAPQMPIQCSEISAEENIPRKFLEHVLFMLKKAGLLDSKLGVSGGYYLSRPATQITVGQVIRALDGRLEPILCVGREAPLECPCPNRATCGVRIVMTEVYEAVANILDTATLEDVAKMAAEAKKSSGEHQIYGNKTALHAQNMEFTI